MTNPYGDDVFNTAAAVGGAENALSTGRNSAPVGALQLATKTSIGGFYLGADGLPSLTPGGASVGSSTTTTPTATTTTPPATTPATTPTSGTGTGSGSGGSTGSGSSGAAAISVVPPSGVVAGATSTATVNFAGSAAPPYSYSLDAENFVACPSQPASGATRFTIALAALNIGQHFLLVKDANNVLSNTGVPSKFTVAPVASGQYAAPGVPRGIGWYQDVFNGSVDSNIANDEANTNMHAPFMLVFPGSFKAIGDVTYRYNQEAAVWKTNANVNGTNRPKVIPVIGMPMQYTDGGLTHRSVITGAFDAQLKQVVSDWASAGILELWVRLDWEIDYPTTPGGMGAQNGAYGSGSTAKSNDSAYCREFIAAFRYMARVMRAEAVSLGLIFKTIWEPAHISSCQLDPRLTFPDNDISDGFGKQVDLNGADFYYNNFYGATVPVLHDGYDNAPPMTPFAATGTAVDIPTWAQNAGSLYYFGDFADGNSTDIYGWGGGWSLFEMINFAATCPLGPNPIIHPEMGGVTTLDGGHNGGLTVTQPDGPAGSHDDGGPYYSEHQARYLRRTWAYAQALGVAVMGGCRWFYESNQMLQTWPAAFPELTIGYTGPTASQVAAPVPSVSVVQPEYHVKPNVPFNLAAFWGVTQPTALDISFDNAATYAAVTSPTINVDRSIIIPHTFIAPGSYRAALRDSSNYAVVGKTNNFTVSNTGQAYTKSVAAMYPGANPFRITAKVQPTSLTSGFIYAIWSNQAALAYTFFIDGSGNLNALYFDGAAYVGAASTVALPASISTTPLFVRATVTSTAGTILFETSPDGNAWTQLGNTITNTAKTPVNGAGLASGSYACIGGCEDGTNLYSGKIFEVKLEVNSAVVFDYNFATQAVSSNNTSTDSAGNVWSVYNPAVQSA